MDFLMACAVVIVVIIFIKLQKPTSVKCEVCENLTNKNNRLCSHCSSLLDLEKHKRLSFIKIVRKELFEFMHKGIISRESLSSLDREYHEEFNSIIDELKKVEIEHTIEVEQGGSQTIKEKIKIEREESLEPLKPTVAIDRETIVQSEKKTNIKWSERLIKSLLYVGVFGLISAVALLLYNYKEGIPDFVKFSILFILTAGIFYSGYLLKYKFDYDRTGLSFLVLAALLLPMNYLSAKVFALIPAQHSYLEWFGVGLFCAILYMFLAKLMREKIFVYLSLIASFICAGLLLRHFALSLSAQCMILLVLGYLYMVTGRMFFKSEDKFYAMPLDRVAIGIAILITIVYAGNLSALMSGNGYLTITAFGNELALFLMTASLLYAVPQLMYLANIAIIGSSISFMQYFSTYNCSPSIGFYLTSYMLAGIGYILFMLGKKDYAKPYYVSSYIFSLIAFIVLGVGFFTEAKYVLAGLFTASVYYGVCAHFTKKEFNSYLTIATILGTIIQYVKISQMPFESISILLIVICLGMCIASNLKIPKHFAAPFFISSHLIVPITSIGFAFYYFDVGKFAYFATFMLFLTAIFYGYNSVVIRKQVFSYVSMVSLYACAVSYMNLRIGLDFVQILPPVALIVLLTTLIGIIFWKIAREQWFWPILNLNLVLISIIVFISAVLIMEGDMPLKSFMYVYLFAGMVTLIYGIFKTAVKSEFMSLYAFLTGVLLVCAYISFLRLNYIGWGEIGVCLILPAFLFLVFSYIYKRLNYIKHAAAFYVLVTGSCGLGMILAESCTIQMFMYTSVLSAVAFAIAALVSRKEIFIYFSTIAFILFFINLLEKIGIVVQYRGFYLLGLSVFLFVIGKIFRPRDFVIVKNPFYVMGFFLTVAVPVCYTLCYIEWYTKYINTVIYTFFVISALYGIMSVILKEKLLMYLSIIVFGIAYSFVLDKYDVPLFNYGIWYLSLGLVVIGIGKVSHPRTLEIKQNPFYVIGLGITVLVVFSLFAAGQMYIGEQINTTIISTLLCALIYGILSYLIKEKRLMCLSFLMVLATYYLFLVKYKVHLSEFYTIFPALILLGWGVREKVKKLQPFYISPSTKINIGLGVYFIPALYQTFNPQAVLEGLIVGISALILVLVSLKVRVKHIFVLGIVIFVVNVLIQAFHYIKFGALPKAVWIGLASIVCIFIGFLGEKRFKTFMIGKVQKTKKTISDYFGDWQ